MNIIKIKYCSQCGWLLRAGWISQELLNTFPTEIDELTLVPSTGGIFEIYVNGNIVWSREKNSGFPEIKDLKRLIRDVIAPDRSLGHIDR